MLEHDICDLLLVVTCFYDCVKISKFSPGIGARSERLVVKR